MDCIDARPILCAFANSELRVEQYLAVLDHLKSCSTCTVLMAERERLSAGTGILDENELAPVELLAQVMKRLVNENVTRLFPV